MALVATNQAPCDAVHVYDSDTVVDLIIDGNDHIRTKCIPRAEAEAWRSRMKRPQSTPYSGRMSHSGSDAQLTNDWLSNTAVGALQERADTEAKRTRKLYEAVLDTEDAFVKQEMEDVVNHKAVTSLRKKEILHKNWTEHVHEPIRKQVVGEMTGPGYPELQRRKRQLHKEYLEHVNKKGHVFLETGSPVEYYAMGLHPTRPSLLVAETKHLRDPLLAQERDRNTEDRTIYRCVTGKDLSDQALTHIRRPPLPLVPLGRHGTENSTWLAMPMGDIESPVRFASSDLRAVHRPALSIETILRPLRRRMSTDVNTSHFTFENWGRPTDQWVIDQEMSIQKRRSQPADDCMMATSPPPPQTPIAAL